MKRKFPHPAPSESELKNGPRYWRSLDELAETPGFKAQLAREFPDGASSLEGVDRRQFMKVMAASFALGGVGLAGCRRPEANILPYGKSVTGVIPGLPLYFATAMPLRKTAIPLLAETHQGRPTKLEGNPSYAPHGGASSLHAQASVLDLYDPDRAKTHTQNGANLTTAAVNDLLAKVGTDHGATHGAGLAFLAEESASPTRSRLVAKLRSKFPRAIWAEYEPVQDEPPLVAAQAAFGKDVKPLYRFAKAKRVVAIDADFLHAESGSLFYAREFTKGRKVVKRDDPMNRLYAVESTFTLTGSMADHRLRLASSHMLAFAAALANKVMGASPLDTLAQGLEFPRQAEWLQACADDLRSHKGECLVVAGSHQPAAVHAIAYAMNAYLGNIGKTVDFLAVEPTAASSISALATAIKAGSIGTLVVLGGNPAYNAPVDLDWSSLQKSVPNVIRYGYYADETSALAGTNLAAAHYLESWGDARTVDGTVVPVQPMILPLFGGLTEIELICRILGEENADPYSQVYLTIGQLSRGDGATVFQKFLHDGLLEGSAYQVTDVKFDVKGTNALFNDAPAPLALSGENLEVRFATDHKVDDGRFINNGWLQECPDPISKITWDNAILISPRLAKEIGITPKGSVIQVARVETAEFDRGTEMAPVAEITLNGRTVKGPLHIQPGLSNYTIVLPLGYGHSITGRVGEGSGFNAYAIRTTATQAYATGASLTLTGEKVKLANTQGHWSMEGRDLVREANLDEVQAADGVGLAYVNAIGLEAHSPPIYGEEGEQMTLAEKATLTPRGNSLYESPNYTGLQQWGMSIDLNTCTGCNACVVACQAENNIPIVGKEQTIRGRSMHWIRLDRYYSDGNADARAMADLFGGEASGNREIPEDPQVSLQPVACVQCELAPCEMVCPVNATVHDDEGLNVMAYNRCIGTRYCANNCPYKVRRFNYFDWNQRQLDSLYLGPLGPQGMPELVKMAKNPEVTVRMRGVMEKCTYCVQRIENGKIQHKVRMAKAGRPGDVIVPDGEIKVACQQACPVTAIDFGNILDPNSAVSQAKAREQDYALLGYLNTRPRTTYLGKLRNPNPRMPDYNKMPFSRIENAKKNHPATHGDAHETEEHAPAHAETEHTSLDNTKSFGGLS
ncbi:MAG: TAT-variant-translocated molybdopterin oxidoreductase [Cephaloticoccus sp.]|nr:TAT-variant-translocated molybdopterin oxidoreductase [Cephaloticoccus sp.]